MPADAELWEVFWEVVERQVAPPFFPEKAIGSAYRYGPKEGVGVKGRIHAGEGPEKTEIGLLEDIFHILVAGRHLVDEAEKGAIILLHQEGESPLVARLGFVEKVPDFLGGQGLTSKAQYSG